MLQPASTAPAPVRHLNRIIYTGLQAVEIGRLSADEAAKFVIEEAEAQFDNVIVRRIVR